MAHKVTFTMPVTDKEYEGVIPNIPAKFMEKLDTYKQLAIVHEILQSKGNSFYEKACVCADAWANEGDNSRIRYKIRHR